MKNLKWFGALLALPAFATTMVALDVPTMAKSANAVVQGTVVAQQAHWNGDKTRIVTDVEIAVKETLKGAPPATVVLTQLGGEIGDVGQRVEGAAQFKVGEEVVVFLEQRGPKYLLVGMAQGKFSVERSTDGTASYAVPDRAGHALLLDPVTRQPRAWNNQVYPLETLKADVRAALTVPTVVPPPTRPTVKDTK